MAVDSVCKFKLQIIALLDSICFGLIYPFLSTYIQSLGADHVTVGILSVGYLLSSLISNDIVVNSMKIQEKRFGMAIVLIITLLAHLSLILTNSYWFIIFGRYLYGTVANQSQNMCKRLLLENDKDLLTVFSVLSGSGYIIGPVIAGYLFDKGFLYIGSLAVFLTFINICLALTISIDGETFKEDSDRRTLLEKIHSNKNDMVEDYRNSYYKRHWDLMAIKFLYASCVMIFYGKFSQILKHNYQSSPITIGNTYAYINSLTFIGAYYTSTIKERYAPFSPIILAEVLLKYFGILLCVACYAPAYFIYMITCIPIVLLSTLMDSIWKDLFTTRDKDSFERLNDFLKISAGLTTPIVFGVLCNNVGHHAVIIFSVIPTIVATFIISMYTKRYYSERCDKKID